MVIQSVLHEVSKEIWLRVIVVSEENTITIIYAKEGAYYIKTFKNMGRGPKFKNPIDVIVTSEGFKPALVALYYGIAADYKRIFKLKTNDKRLAYWFDSNFNWSKLYLLELGKKGR